MIEVEPSDEIVDAEVPRLRGGFVALVGVLGVVVILGSVVLLTARRATGSQPWTSGTLRGQDFIVVGGLNQNLPDRVAFDRDGTFRVVDGGRTVDTGTYAVWDDKISVVSEWVEGRGPEHYGVMWAEPDCPGCHLMNVPMISDRCQGVVGEYRFEFDTPTTISFEVVWDECLQRTLVANGLQLAVSGRG